ncbi:MAG: RloB domain-containing protein [Bacilli bacterium]|nr:RloB domain-containing protein [Bacilli bacterium]
MSRIASINSFTRPSKIREVKKKYFFAAEGENAEISYLIGLINSKKTNAHIFYFYKDGQKGDSSNLLKITMSIIDDTIKGQVPLRLMFNDIVELIFDIFSDNKIIVEKQKIKKITQSFASKKNKKLKDEATETEIIELMEKMDELKFVKTKLEDLFEKDNLISLVNKQCLYEKEIDEIIIIGDRDRQSFTDDQYDLVVSRSRANNLKLIITNPCIEFWFLLHYTSKMTIIKNNWNNVRDAANQTLKALKKYDERYSKTSYNVDLYLRKSQTAIKNSKKFCNSLDELKTNIGTNMPDLLNIIKNMP